MKISTRAFTASILILGLTSAGTAAQATTPDQPEESQTANQLVEELSLDLQEKAEDGNREAAESVETLEALSDKRAEELGEILAGESEIDVSTPSSDAQPSIEDGALVYVDGDAEWVFESSESEKVSSSSTAVTPLAIVAASNLIFKNQIFAAASVKKSVWGTQSFKFAGIKLSEVKTWGKYTVRSGKVTALGEYGCQVVRNLVPGTTITVSKQSRSKTTKTASFKCKVRVDRGVIKGVNWSTVESYHRITANAAGKVTRNGWV